jgi:serine/threonine-protein kinase RsbW
MNQQDFVELKFPAKPEYVGVARLLMSGVASRLGFAVDDIEDIKLAVAEACTNATLHAYQGEQGQIIITCTAFEDRIEIMVIDHGRSFDIEHIRYRMKPIDHRTPIEQLHEGGLGLFLIETLMDEVQIQNDDGIAISMVKYRRRDEVENDESSFKTTPSI